MLTDIDGVRFDMSIPPPKVRDDLIDRLKEDARDFLPAPMLDILECIPKPWDTPIYDLLVNRMVYEASPGRRVITPPPRERRSGTILAAILVR